MTQSLSDIRADIARQLAEGAASRRSACHTPVVGTADADMRVMVLRAFDPDSWTLRFHTDARSPKAQLIGEGAPAGVLFYDREAKVQMRCRGEGRIATQGETVDAAWAASTNFARRCYLGAEPGAISDTPTSGLPDWAEGVQPTEEQVAPAREHFALLLVTLREVDWLYLSNEGHRRAVLQVPAGEARWVTP
ncbi:pyridoxamine 5'-phosphate oxidase family protein [Aurantiacibacter aquimixticola]|uniref:Flavin-binding protein n=1 Tax=Aurantiacibacter aquimixticola TaxID=1958945 RepID=A0A419RR53_9SPHN|nr:pyridoxamine 5'-phosphate oxidase family protein [Aurantiacibacter aquimixticola]RJY08283.1 flavin-binding protein [Aurantiacibacter aquimixticola]